MAILARVNFVAQSRVDLHHYLAMESFTAADFRAIVTSLVGQNKPYIARGLQVVGNNGLTVNLEVANAQIFNPLDKNASFYVGLPDDADIILDLPGDQANIFVEAVFKNTTQAPTNIGLWDPSSTTGEDSSGQEYTASADTQNIVYLEITSNTVGFTNGAIPLFRASTSTSVVTNFVDSRDLLFRLGTGGANPDQLNKYDWSTTRNESVPSGTGVGDAANSPWQAKDSTGAINDKSFESLKDWMDAVMTRIGELDTFPWYKGSASSTGISLPKLFFDTIGHSIQPSDNSAFKFVDDSGYKLIGEGSATVNGVTGQHHEGLIKWQANNSGLAWSLGGTFVNNAPAGKRNYTAGGLRFESPAVENKGNIYLYLERDVQKGTGASINWSNAGTSSFTTTESVSGSTGDFTGIAIGDYIRKESGVLNDYLKVTGFWDGTNTYSILNDIDQNRVADSTIITLQLQSIINPNSTSVSESVEPLRYFRSRYADIDLVSDNMVGANGLMYNYQNVDFYWLGRRDDELFYLRNYGTMQLGEEVTTLDMSNAQGQTPGDSSLVIEHAKQAAYDITNGYYLKSGSGSLLTIHRRKRDNTVGYPSDLDNSGSLLTYTITAPVVAAMSNGQGLWVRLSDTASGALVAGNVTDASDAEDNTQDVTNVYEIRSAAQAPERDYDNLDVFLLAKRTVINGQAALMFADGSVISDFGQLLNTNVDISGEVRLQSFDDMAIPFISHTGSKVVDEDATNFFYDKLNAILGVFNFRFENNRLYQAVPEDVSLFDNLGSHTLTIGNASSTVVVAGDFVVQGRNIISQTENVQAEDKLITLGIGALLDTNNGAGIEIADDTRTPIDTSTSNGSADVILTFTNTLPYSNSDVVSVNSTKAIGGITAGQISGAYTIVALATTVGQAQLLSPVLLKIVTPGTATATESSLSDNPTVAYSPFSIRLGSPDTTYSGVTSWILKNKLGKTAITPIAGYDTVTTSKASELVNMRIPFVYDDGINPTSVDSTLKYVSEFTWDDSSKTLGVSNLYVTNEARVGDYLRLDHQASAPSTAGLGNDIRIYQNNGYVFSVNSVGDIKMLTNDNEGGVYEEINDIVAPIAINDTTTIPDDTNWIVDLDAFASTSIGSNIVTVKVKAHGLTTGDLVNIATSTAIGGISSANLTQSAEAVTVIDPETFTYTAAANATLTSTGYLDAIITTKTRYYLVGSNELEIYLNGQKLTKGLEYQEVGSYYNQSNQIQWLVPLEVGTPANKIKYRMDSNGGHVILLQSIGGGGTLQDAYNGGTTISIFSGTPVTVNGPSGEVVLHVTQDLQVDGLIL